MRNYRYSHGLPFSEILADKGLDPIIKRVARKKAGMIILSGGLGEGKTTLLVEILDYINHMNGLPKINFKNQLALGGVDFLKKIRLCFEKKLPCIGYDEAGDFSRRGSLTQFNRMLNRTFETFRAFRCIVVLALPNFEVLDQQLYDNHIPRLLIHLRNRTANEGNFRTYSLYRMNLLKSCMKRYKMKNYAFVRITPNFYGHFLDLDPERSRELDRISTKNKLNILRKSEIKIEGLLTYPELAIKLQRSIYWVRTAVSSLKMKPARTIGRAKYFSNDHLNILSNYLEGTGDPEHMRK